MGKKISSRKKKIISRRKRKSNIKRKSKRKSNIKRKSKRRSNRRSKRRSKSQKKQRGGANGQEVSKEYAINKDIKALNKDIDGAISKLKKSQNRKMLHHLKDKWSCEIETTSKEDLALTRSNLVDNLIGKMVEWSEHDKMRPLKEVMDELRNDTMKSTILSGLGKEIENALSEYSQVNVNNVNTVGGSYKMLAAKNDPVSLLVASMIEFILNPNGDFESSGALLAFIFAMITAIFIVRADRARGMSNEARDERKRSHNC